ncbi:rho/rac/cdc gtpase-activating protein [Anaeramoeba flamelloides]|uniref:Rho/rac/cdc gtpase-activating protein n=1 Tax=Anaeramoeba flamelloides TaxID=1746091 RepID=A0ABQ8YF97_9EUKA|nr:rho/rac/cdc gtpase-activating protein [Anaeramoeba flamelloides]
MLKRFQKKSEGPTFGKPLPKKGLPVVLCVLVSHLRRVNALNREGIFRIAGHKLRIGELKKIFDQGKIPNLRNVEMNDIAGLLKLFLRQLPDSLTTSALFDELISTIKITDKQTQIDKFKDIIHHKLPQERQRLLKYLMEFLHEISLNEEKNLMNNENLAIVFGPSLMRLTPDRLKELAILTPSITKIAQVIFESYNYIFDDLEVDYEIDYELINPKQTFVPSLFRSLMKKRKEKGKINQNLKKTTSTTTTTTTTTTTLSSSSNQQIPKKTTNVQEYQGINIDIIDTFIQQLEKYGDSKLSYEDLFQIINKEDLEQFSSSKDVIEFFKEFLTKIVEESDGVPKFILSGDFFSDNNSPYAKDDFENDFDTLEISELRDEIFDEIDQAFFPLNFLKDGFC